jgi:hypothetical protein
LTKYYIDNNIDVAICDHFADACVEAAKMLNLSFIVTGTLDLSQGIVKSTNISQCVANITLV